MVKKSENEETQSTKSGLRLGKVAVMAGTAIAVSTGMIAKADDTQTVAEPDPSVAESGEVTSEQVADATAAAAQSQAQVNRQETVVQQAAQEVKSAEQTLKQAQVAEKAAKENLSQTQKQDIQQVSAQLDIEKANQVAAQSELKTAQTAYGQVKQDVAEQTGVVKKEEEEVKKAQAALDKAKAGLKNAEAEVDGSAVKQAESNVKTAEKQVASKQTAYEKAQVAIKQAQTADQKRQEQIKAAEKQVAAVKKTVATTKAAYEKAQATQTSYKSVNKITVKSDYVSALKSHAAKRKSAKEVEKVAIKQLALNAYQSEKGDERAVGNWASLSTSTKEELNQFALGLINNVRSAFGYKNAVLTKGMVNFAADVAKNYEKNNRSGFHGHETDSIKKAAAANGLSTTASSAASLAYEDLNMYPYNVSTVGGLKHAIYDSFRSLLFNDLALAGSWGHAVSLAGLNNLYWAGADYPVDQAYFGVSISSVGGSASVHIMKVEGSNRIVNSKFNKTVVKASTSKDTSSYLTAYKAAQSKLATAEKTLKSKKAIAVQSTAAQDKLKSAYRDLTYWQTNLAGAKSDLTAAKNRFNTSQTIKETARKEASAAFTKAQNRLNSLHASLLRETKSLKTLQEQLKVANKQVATAASAVKAAQKKVQSVEALLQNINTASAKYQAAQTLRKKAEQHLLDKKAAFSVRKLKLTELQNKNHALQERKNTLLAAFRKATPESLVKLEPSLAKVARRVAVTEKAAPTTQQSELHQTAQPVQPVKETSEQAIETVQPAKTVAPKTEKTSTSAAVAEVVSKSAVGEKQVARKAIASSTQVEAVAEPLTSASEQTIAVPTEAPAPSVVTSADHQAKAAADQPMKPKAAAPAVALKDADVQDTDPTVLATGVTVTAGAISIGGAAVSLKKRKDDAE